MKTCDYLEDFMKNDVISRIYNNDFNFAERVPTTEEYTQIMQAIKNLEKGLLNVENFKKYLEIRNIKDAIEAEEQFKLGFKLAVKIIIESYQP